MDYHIFEKLKIIKHFQDKYPLSHVGGSIGLCLHGIDLKRSLKNSDIDITVPNKLEQDIPFETYEVSSSPSDFDYSFRAAETKSNLYSKIEIRITPEPSFVIIEFDGIKYNVSKLVDILFWKQKYADKGVQKHIDDMIVINGCERPVANAVVLSDFDSTDELPF